MGDEKHTSGGEGKTEIVGDFDQTNGLADGLGGHDDASGPQGVAATAGGDAAEPPPADFDPAEHPSNPDLVADEENPDR